MRRACKTPGSILAGFARARKAERLLALPLVGMLIGISLCGAARAAAACDKPVYLTFDTGHMGIAPLVADVLKRHQVQATFFLANEKTLTGGSSLDEQWAPWWRERAAEGHAFGSHTWDHHVWLGDAADGRIRTKPTMGAQAGQVRTFDAAGYCEQIERSAQRFEQMTGQRMSRLFRAPGGKVSPALHKLAAQCGGAPSAAGGSVAGYTHVPWSPAGFLGDELSSERFPNDQLLRQALRDVKAGDILLAHLGIWSRKEPWAPAVLEPLIVGLKARGLCFATLRDHPQYRAAALATR